MRALPESKIVSHTKSLLSMFEQTVLNSLSCLYMIYNPPDAQSMQPFRTVFFTFDPMQEQE